MGYVPNAPKYTSPKQAAEDRARLRSRLIWIAAAIPLLLMLCMFGYSDQAPGFLRTVIIEIDRTLGYPILGLISWLGG